MGPPGNSTSDTPQPPDEELVRQITHGSQTAFRELSARHARYLYGIACSLAGDAGDAEDLVQETFLALLTSRFRGESSVRTWLVAVLVRQAAMLQRTRKRKWPRLAREPLPEDAPTPSGEARADAKLDLAAMLAALTPEHRQVIVLRELEGMSYDEIAAALGVPRGTIESRLHRARAELRERFKGYL